VLATYRVTGVLNVAFGALGMFGAYLTRALVRDAHLPEYAAGLLVVCCVAPLLGLGLEPIVFGPLQARAADAARLLTAGFGVTVLLVGLATAIWGVQARTDAPTLLPGGTSRIAGVDVPTAVPIELVLVLLVALGLAWFSRGGPALRAVIDDRKLAELAGLPARRLARIGWAAGTALATLTGILLAPQLRFDPTALTLLLFETLGVAIAARLRSAPVAILAAFATAIAQAELTGVHLTGTDGAVLDAVRSNLFVVLLLGATWLIPAFNAPRAAAAGADARSSAAVATGATVFESMFKAASASASASTAASTSLSPSVSVPTPAPELAPELAYAAHRGGVRLVAGWRPPYRSRSAWPVCCDQPTCAPR
jgi:branched-chain amino acid transport system permease protein